MSSAPESAPEELEAPHNRAPAALLPLRHTGYESDGDVDMDPVPATAPVDGILKAGPGLARRRRKRAPLHATAAEKEREKGLSGDGDEGELGRRLEAVLTLHGNGDGSVRRKKHWDTDYEDEYEAEAE